MIKWILLTVYIFLISIMADYIAAGFDNNLLREVSLNSFEYNPNNTEALLSEMDGNKITTNLPGNVVGQGIKADNITTGEMSFDRAKGGTLQLGGYNNQSGIFSLKDSDEIERLSMDKDGMVISGGKITITDKNNNSVLDAFGLVSQTNFKNGFYVSDFGSPFTTTSSSYVNVTDAQISFVLARPSNVLFGTNVSGTNTGATDATQAGAVIRLVVNGTTHGGFSFLNPIVTGAGNYKASGAITYILSLRSGFHTIQLQAARDFGAGTAQIETVDIWYVVLGS